MSNIVHLTYKQRYLSFPSAALGSWGLPSTQRRFDSVLGFKKDSTSYIIKGHIVEVSV